MFSYGITINLEIVHTTLYELSQRHIHVCKHERLYNKEGSTVTTENEVTTERSW